MRKNIGAKALIYPQPVLVLSTYNADGTADAMTAAWGGVREANKIFVVLDESHKTTQNLLRDGAFVVNIGDEEHVVACDYVGLVSANECTDKMQKAGFTVTESQFVHAPIVNELKLALECKVLSFQDELLIGEVVNVSAKEEILTDGKVDVAKLKPITYDSAGHTYVALGKIVGKAFFDGNKLK